MGKNANYMLTYKLCNSNICPLWIKSHYIITIVYLYTFSFVKAIVMEEMEGGENGLSGAAAFVNKPSRRIIRGSSGSPGYERYHNDDQISTTGVSASSRKYRCCVGITVAVILLLAAAGLAVGLGIGLSGTLIVQCNNNRAF